jgi:hypothetical protein
MPITYVMRLVNIALYSFTWVGFILNLTYLLLLSSIIITPCIAIYVHQYNKKTKKIGVQDV